MMSQCTQVKTAALLLLCVAVVANGQKWSRQLEPTVPGAAGVADSFDWIPLAQPVDTSVGGGGGGGVDVGGISGNDDRGKDRSANGRVLTYSQTFPPDAHFGNLPPPKPHFSQQQQQQPHLQQHHQPQAFDFPYQFQRFLNTPQTQPLRAGGPLKAPQEPTSQSFFKFEMPLHGEANRQISGGSPSVQTGYQIQHSAFGGAGSQAALFNQALFNQQPVFPPEFHPLPQKSLAQSLEQQKPLAQQNFIEDTLPLKNTYHETKPHPTQQALQAVAPQVFPVDTPVEPSYELNKPVSFQTQPAYQQTGSVPTASPSLGGNDPGAQSQQNVQLLYVPYDTLYNQQQSQPQSQGAQSSAASQSAYELNKYNVNSGLPAVNPYQINQFYTQDPVTQPEANFYTTSTTSRPLTTSSLKPDLFQSFVTSSQPQFTTAKPKPKAHQPPLAMFMLRSSARPTQSDVVSTLRNANTISVIDAPTKQTPSIFVGPAGMPVPEGYVKFDLPYLSQLSQKRDLREVPFFVAPLSYRTPSGFNKILLPEPHVGSIVVNRANDFASPAHSSLDVSQYTSTAPPRTRPTQPQRITTPVNGKDYYSNSDVVRQPSKLRDPFEITTQRATLPTNRGNKFNYYYDQDQVIHEVTSPKISKLDRPKKKRPQSVQIEQYQPSQQVNLNNNPYTQYARPAPNQIGTEEYFKVSQAKPTTISTSTSISPSTTSTSTTTSTTSTTATPQTYFSYNTSPQVEFQSTKGQLYPNLNTASQTTADEHVPRFTTRPPLLATSDDEEYQMKQYFRQQNAFRNRPQLVPSTLSPYEQVQYTPVALDFDHEVKIPSAATTQKTTTVTPKQRITFYTPTPTPATVSTLDQQLNTVTPQYSSDNVLPANHRPAFNQNEIFDDITEYEPNLNPLPSKLPSLAPNLPGLVNGLQEKNKLNVIGFESSTAAATTTLEPEQVTRPTRRPINRVRKPIISKISSSVSFSESESTSRRPAQRVRRPLPPRTSSVSSDTESTTTSTTRRPTSSRTAIIRNPNRIRYQPTPEERQSFRLKTRKYANGSKKATASEDLEYQRDVLKQNYPVFKPNRKGTSPTAIPTSYSTSIGTEVPTSESQQVYTVTPSNSIDNDPDRFPASLLEPMQIAEQYNEYTKDNYGPGYFPNQEDLAPTEPSLRNEINPYNTIQSTTISTTTTLAPTTTTTPAPVEEEVAITTRRSPFVRRNYPRLRTTTEATTTTQAPEEKSSIRPRIPPRKVIKVRQRTRRPYQPASSTASSIPEGEHEEQEQRQNFRKVNRYNQDLYENDSARRRLKTKSNFQLEGQESQWSPALKTVNSHNFKPFNPKDKRNKDEHKVENEPEIVTASPTIETQNDNDNFETSVSANLASSSQKDQTKKSVIKAPNLKPEKSFAELLEEVMGKAPEEEPLDTSPDKDTRTTDGTFFESHKTTIGDRFNRRGKWKKLRNSANTTPSGESFETAESQNLGSQLLNSLYSGSNRETADEIVKDFRTTTPITPEGKVSSTAPTGLPFFFTTTPTPQSTIDDYDMTTSRQLESTTQPLSMDDIVSTTAANVQTEDVTEEMATRRHDESYDDLDTQSSLFSEVKKQLHDLFAIEENENENEQAVTAALAAVGRRRQEYTNIKRVNNKSTTTENDSDASLPVTEPTPIETDKKSPFHKNLMDHAVYATSTSTKITSETEICYRGRCVRSEDLPPNHKLN